VPGPKAIAPSAVLASIPAGLRDPLLDSFAKITVNFRERRWEPAELNGGKFCEVVYTILRGHVDGAFPPGPSKPSNMVDACRDLEKANASFPRSVRIQIPRVLVALYEIRNNRNVGHVGGDVNPNHMDASVVLAMAQWVMAELIRLFHGTDTKAATETVDALVERTVPVVWEVGGRRRVLEPSLSWRKQMLLLLLSMPAPVAEATLVTDWLEHPSAAVFRRDVLRPAHKARLVDYDEAAGTVTLSPKGTFQAEALALELRLV
jgi:hypothetical protein